MPDLTVGWVKKSWRPWMVKCVRCEDRISSGVVNHHDECDPKPHAALCIACYALVRGAQPGEVATPGIVLD